MSEINQHRNERKGQPNRAWLIDGEEANLLLPLMPHAPHMYVEDNIMKTSLQFETPINEYGIPQRELLIYQLIGSVAAEHTWSGYYDLHHIVHPRSNYIYKEGKWNADSAAARFRGSESLMIRQVRQLHMYNHLMVRKPEKLDDAVYEAFLHENDQMKYLYRTANITSEEGVSGIINQQLESRRELFYQAAIRRMQPGQVGHLPSLEYLASLSVAEARAFLRYKLLPLSMSMLAAYACRESTTSV